METTEGQEKPGPGPSRLIGFAVVALLLVVMIGLALYAFKPAGNRKLTVPEYLPVNATIISSSGSVLVLRGNYWQSMARNSSITEGDLLTTGSATGTVLFLDGENNLRPDQETRLNFLEIKKSEKTGRLKVRLMLEQGRLWVAANANADLQVETVNSMAIPQPTNTQIRFGVECTGDGTQVLVQEGSIRFYATDDPSQELVVEGGQRASFTLAGQLLLKNNIRAADLDRWETWNQGLKVGGIGTRVKTPAAVVPAPLSSAAVKPSPAVISTPAPVATAPLQSPIPAAGTPTPPSGNLTVTQPGPEEPDQGASTPEPEPSAQAGSPRPGTPNIPPPVPGSGGSPTRLGPPGGNPGNPSAPVPTPTPFGTPTTGVPGYDPGSKPEGPSGGYGTGGVY